jgi:hypothetical protein
MKEIFVLFNGDTNMCWFLDKNHAQQVLDNNVNNFCFPELTSVMIEEDLYEKLKPLQAQGSQINSHFNVTKVPESYFVKEKQKELASWRIQEGFRMYMMFIKTGKAVFSPSGNNLESFYEENPDEYLAKPFRVELSYINEAKILACFEWACDCF